MQSSVTIKDVRPKGARGGTPWGYRITGYLAARDVDGFFEQMERAYTRCFMEGVTPATLLVDARDAGAVAAPLYVARLQEFTSRWAPKSDNCVTRQCFVIPDGRAASLIASVTQLLPFTVPTLVTRDLGEGEQWVKGGRAPPLAAPNAIYKLAD